MQSFDAVIIGAGAAGLFCAGVAGQLGLKVLVLDHSEKVAEKIRISGGGRCNFTNLGTTAANFLSNNPRFCRSALSRYTPQDFLALLHKHQIAFHEKHKGQLFCDTSAEDIIQMLLAECGASGNVTRWQPCAVKNVRFLSASPRGDYAGSYEIDSDRGTIQCGAVVVATGGLSIPKIGATDFGYRLAKQFELPLITTRPALVPLTFDEEAWAPFAQLSGLSLPVRIETGSKKEKIGFLEDLLFTHRGLSGPGVLQISSYWQAGTPIRLDLAPDTNVADLLSQAKGRSRRLIANEVATLVPARLAAGALRKTAGAPGRHLDLPGCQPGPRLGTPHQRGQRQSPLRPGRTPVPLGTHPHRHRGLPQGRGHRWRCGHQSPVQPDDGVHAAGPVFHWRGGGRDRLARRLQLPVGLGQCLCMRPGTGPAATLKAL